MSTLGTRELRDGLSRQLAAARAGETIAVTDHGASVARLTPIDRPGAFDRLVAEGVIEPPSTLRRQLPDPVVPEDSGLRLSEPVIADRG